MADNNLLVMKFGGTSIGTTAAMAQAVRICQEAHRSWRRLVVVTSALSGITDHLIASAQQAARGNLSTFHATLSELSERHHLLVAPRCGARSAASRYRPKSIPLLTWARSRP